MPARKDRTPDVENTILDLVSETDWDTWQAIRTHCLPPKNFVGSRVVAVDDPTNDVPVRRVIVQYRDELDTEDNHRRAAEYWLHTFMPSSDQRYTRIELAPFGLAFDGKYFWTWQFRGTARFTSTERKT